MSVMTLRTFCDALESAIAAVAGALLAALLVPVTIQVFARLIPGFDAPLWTEEAARFLLVWTIMVGSMLALRRSANFVVDLLPGLSSRGTAWLDRLALLVVLFFGAFTSWWGIDFVAFGWNQTSETADWPMWWVFIAWPVAGVVWMLFAFDALKHGSPARNDGAPPQDMTA